MCSSEPSPSSPSTALRNWRDSDLPFWRKLRVALRNEWKKIRTRQTCCGNHGEPGC